MVDSKLLGSIDLADKAGETHVRRLVQDVLQFREVREAFEAAQVLAERLKGKRDLEQRYAPQLASLKAAALPLLTEEGALTVFGEYFPAVLGENSVDIVQGLKQRATGMPLDDRRRFFATIVQQLSAAQVSLTKVPLTLEDGTVRPPTLGNWTQVLREKIESGVDALLGSAFITNLPDDEESKVRRLAHVLDIARREATGELAADDMVIRDADGMLRMLSGGDIVPLATGTRQDVAVAPAAPARPPVPTQPGAGTIPQQQKPVEEKKVVPPTVAPAPLIKPAAVGPQKPEAIPKAPPQVVVPPAAPSLPSAPRPLAPREEFRAPSEQQIAQTQYSLEDEEEIQKQTERLRTMDTEPSADAVLDRRVEELVRSQHLVFPDDNIRRRFFLTMKTFIKGIRNRTETEEVLARPEKIGGVGYAPAIVAAVMVAAQEFIAQRGHHEGVRELVEEAKKQDIPTGIPPMPEVPKPAAFMPPPPPVPVVPQAPPPVPQPPQPATPAPAMQPAHVDFKPIQQSQGRPLRGLATERTKRSLADIVAPKKKLAGPSEEIRSMNLDDFHKLGGTPRDRIQKLYSRFVSLSKESFTMRMEGIKAWRESPVYRLYLDVGAESLNTGKAVAEVIANRSAQGRETVSEDEFHYIADLNRQLQFS